MSRLLDALKNDTNFTKTENNAVARKTTGSELLNFFSHGGALRGAGATRAVPLFSKAWSEDKLAALKLMFYFRDVRGGQGQRDAFRDQLKYLASLDSNSVLRNLELIAEYGRWDDLYALVGTPLEKYAFEIMKEQFISDYNNMKEGKPVSLLAKWLKSETKAKKGSKKEERKILASKTRKAFGLTPRSYRKAVSALRKHIDVLEVNMSANKWENIKYQNLPSNAMQKHLTAFFTHDYDRFSDYMGKVKSGKAKVNTATLYPHELVHNVMYGRNVEANDVLWNNLPNYIGDSTENSIAVVDTSGSMSGLPMEVAISLGLYLSERAKGAYKDHFITFSASPELQKVVGNNLWEKVSNLSQAAWQYNTDIEAVFDLILNTAIRHNIPQEEMLTKLYVISDMEFDEGTSSKRSYFGGWEKYSPKREVPKVTETLMQSIEAKFNRNGYKMPILVFWNVNARNEQYPMSLDDRGFLNVSGFSPSIFTKLLKSEYVTPESLMMDVINSERYAALTV